MSYVYAKSNWPKIITNGTVTKQIYTPPGWVFTRTGGQDMGPSPNAVYPSTLMAYVLLVMRLLTVVS